MTAGHAGEILSGTVTTTTGIAVKVGESSNLRVFECLTKPVQTPQNHTRPAGRKALPHASSPLAQHQTRTALLNKTMLSCYRTAFRRQHRRTWRGSLQSRQRHWTGILLNQSLLRLPELNPVFGLQPPQSRRSCPRGHLTGNPLPWCAVPDASQSTGPENRSNRRTDASSSAVDSKAITP